MASRYNFDAQRAADINVKPKKGSVPEWDVEPRQPDPWGRDVSDVDNKGPRTPSRVLNLTLDSAKATQISDNSVTWHVSMPNVGMLKPGTLLYLNCVATNAPTPGEWRLSGIAAETTGDTIRGYFETKAGNILAPIGAVPLCVTIKDPSCLLNNYFTFTRTPTIPTFLSTQEFYLKLFLTLVEPGANFP